MRPAHSNMYVQPAYALPQNPVQYYAANCPPGNSPVPQYGRNPQDPQPQLQPVYLVHQQPVMHQYPAVVGVPTQVVGNPIPQAMAMQGGPAYGVQGWAYNRPAMVESPPPSLWGYGLDRSRGYAEHQQQEPRMSSNWQRTPLQGYPGNGAGGPGNLQGRADGHGNVQSFGRPDRGFESGSRHCSSDGPSRQHMSRQAPPPQSPATSQVKQLNCEACEKTFTVHSQYMAHMNTHVQCDEMGCSFSASGKVVKEHKLTAHVKSSNPNPMSAVKAARKVSEESNDEIKAWREERMRNYPTRSNIQRKKEALEGKVARGELIDEDTRQRRQRMKEILAKQAELGVPVAEVPAYYLSQPHKDDRTRARKNSDCNPSTGKQMAHLKTSTVDASSASASANGADSKKRKLGEDAKVTTAIEEQPTKSARVNTDQSNGHSNSVLSNAELRTKSQVKVVAQAEPESVPRREDTEEAAGRQPVEKSSKQQCYFYQRGRCKKGSRCHFSHTGPRGKKGGEGEAGRGGQKGEKKRPPTLLSKLLQADIMRDKSYILQCLRFFVNNNFLLDWPMQPSQSVQLATESDAAEDSSDYSEGEVVEAPDVLQADTAIIHTLLSERPEVLAKVLEMETEA